MKSLTEFGVWMEDSPIKLEITEKKAPTDDSIRLYGELLDKAKAEIVKSVSVSDNKFSGVVHLREKFESDLIEFAVIFTMNGTKHTVPVQCSPSDPKEKVIDTVVRAVSDKVAFEILRYPLSEALRKGIFRE